MAASCFFAVGSQGRERPNLTFGMAVDLELPLRIVSSRLAYFIEAEGPLIRMLNGNNLRLWQSWKAISSASSKVHTTRSARLRV